MQSLRRSPRKARSSHHVELAPIEIPVALLASGGGVSSAPSGSIAKAPGATTVSVQLKARHIADDRSTRITKAKGKVGTRSSRGGATARDKVPSGRCMRHASDAGDTQRRDDDNKAVQSTSLPRARAPSPSLPSLLDHLSLSPAESSFPVRPTDATFSFESPPPSPPSSPPKRDLSSLDRQSAASSRLKKRKVLHNFYRSPLILSGPSSSATATDPVTLPRRTTPRAASSSSSPAWWASVSRCDGESRQSRFAPDEEEWIAANYDDSWSSAQSSTTSFSIEGPAITTRSIPSLSRSESAPAVLESLVPFEGAPGGGANAEAEQISGPALKKLLLLSLRQKWSNEGVPTSAGEAALRFKKWVLWNAWRLETQGVESDLTEEYATCGEDNDSDMEWIDPDDELDDNEFGNDENDDGDSMTIVPHEYFADLSSGQESSYAGGCVFSLTGQMIDLSLPTPPSSSSSSPRRQQTQQQYTYLSAALPDIELGSSQSKPPTPQPQVRPGSRRSSTVPTSLPSASLDTTFSQAHVQVSISHATAPSSSPDLGDSASPAPSLVPVISHVLICEG
ncbi:hypothetical protein JCM3766R1_002088 [Sporobolomyces carnicolor]